MSSHPTTPNRGTRRDEEPVIFSASVTNGTKTLVLAVMSLGLAFGWIDWSPEQIGAVLGVVAAGFVVLSAVFAAITHQKVSPIFRNESTNNTE